MRNVTDGFLLTVAEISATLIGLLLVAVFFYLETGVRRLTSIARVAEALLRSTTKLIVLLYSLVLGLSLGLIVLDPVWVAVLFAVLSLVVVAGLVELTIRTRNLSPELRRAVRIHPLLAWPMVLLPLALPWFLGGWTPDREALALAVFLGGAMAFMNTLGLLLLAFDLEAIERASRAGDGGATSPDR